MDKKKLPLLRSRLGVDGHSPPQCRQENRARGGLLKKRVLGLPERAGGRSGHSPPGPQEPWACSSRRGGRLPLSAPAVAVGASCAGVAIPATL